MTPSLSAFDLPPHLAAKSTDTLIARDAEHLGRIAAVLDHVRSEVTARLDAARQGRERGGTAALERDQEIRRLSAQLRLLQRYGVDLCLGRMVAADGSVRYLGRLGLRDPEGQPLLLDWRTPAAEPFFAATHADPMGLTSRRRYRWSRGRITDFWDEVFTADGLSEGAESATLDDQSAFIASLGGPRSERMRDVLATIQADQHAIIRDGSRGALVVDGGPGTGKTVVALHRTAQLLHSDPRIGRRHGGVLFVGPSNPYLDYVSDVLPSLGEEGVQLCTLHQLVPEGDAARPETDPEVRRLKSDVRMVGAIEPAVALHEEPPTDSVEVDTEWGDVSFGAAEWAEAFGAVEPGTPHNEAREQLWTALAGLAVDQLTDEAEEELEAADVSAALHRSAELNEVLGEAWPMLEPVDLVADLWTVPAYLRRCAPWLSNDEVRRLCREDGYAWTEADLPLLDAARRRLGDPGVARRQRQQAAARAAGREEMERVVDHLIASDPTELQVMAMLRGADLRAALDDPEAVAEGDRDRLAGPFAHLVVDEAQELTEAQWCQLLARCPSRSLTIVGDRAQARHGFTESWAERLARVGLDNVRTSTLTVNYRTPAAVMAAAEPVIRVVLPDVSVPTSVRDNGLPVRRGRVAELAEIVAEWGRTNSEGIACVVGDPAYPGSERIRSLTPESAKGLEFDLVVLVRPESFGDGIEGAVDRYVAMTRTTGQLVLLF
ncbi:AAA family ATPase [Enemella dayhoffiae]|uniref:AAA family ATPase n=1 Tax=Enemella dayhoffiae TaxID=2016507 RepID=A0A255HBT5_9ACTN|nr:RNA polymerase recycling motor ATPase HelR [Enemella dayhoffiae]OYO25131.1 AAA family ATPase [Enemella dayhoffiae]